MIQYEAQDKTRAPCTARCSARLGRAKIPPPEAVPVVALFAHAGWACACDSRKVSPPDDALLLGLALVAEMERWTPRWTCEGDCAFPDDTAPGGRFQRDSELPDRDPSLSGWKRKKINRYSNIHAKVRSCLECK